MKAPDELCDLFDLETCPGKRALARLDTIKDRVVWWTAAAGTPQRPADQAAFISYGPTRKPSAQLVGKHATLGIEMRPQMPTDPDNSSNTLACDDEWWSDKRICGLLFERMIVMSLVTTFSCIALGYPVAWLPANLPTRTANPLTTFFRVQRPLILPGAISGGLFAFITSFAEVVVALFVGSANLQTRPWRMVTGLREQISPTILAIIPIILPSTIEILRRRSERLRGMDPGPSPAPGAARNLDNPAPL